MPDYRRRARPRSAARSKVLALFGFLLLNLGVPGTTILAPCGALEEPSSFSSYLIPRSQFNITDRNLSFATNLVVLSPSVNSSFTLVVSDTLVASPAYPAASAEAEIGLGPAPNPLGGDETYLTPLLILQAAATGFLRLEYIPFAMNDTLGFVIYSGTPVPGGPSAFAHQLIEIEFAQSGPLVAPYQPTLPYGQANGNVSLLLDGARIAGPYPVDWATLSAFYGYGLTTGRFLAGAVYANITSVPANQLPGPTRLLLSLTEWEVALALVTLSGAIGLITWARFRVDFP